MKNFIIFVIGGCVGATASYFYCQKKFNDMLNAELAKTSSKEEPSADIPEKEPEEPSGEQRKAIADIHEKPDIFDYSKIAMADKIPPVEPADEYTTRDDGNMSMISVEKFEDLSYEYEEQDLIYYKDGIVTDVQDNVIFHGLNELVAGMTEDDFDENGYLYVSDPESQHIYEITKDDRKWSDVFNSEED